MTPSVAYSQHRATRTGREQKTPWIVTTRSGDVVQHRYFATERKAREACGLKGGSDDIGYKP